MYVLTIITCFKSCDVVELGLSFMELDSRLVEIVVLVLLRGYSLRIESTVTLGQTCFQINPTMGLNVV